MSPRGGNSLDTIEIDCAHAIASAGFTIGLNRYQANPRRKQESPVSFNQKLCVAWPTGLFNDLAASCWSANGTFRGPE